jgi:hypothetical protein
MCFSSGTVYNRKRMKINNINFLDVLKIDTDANIIMKYRNVCWSIYSSLFIKTQ